MRTRTAGRSTAASNPDERASVYVLKMGQPVRIYDLAERMIRLAGFEPGEDIDIVVTGTRPGERLHEILFAREEPMAEIGIDGVMAAKPVFADRPQVEAWLDAPRPRRVAAGDRAAAERVFEEAIPEFRRRPQPDAREPSQRVPRRHGRLPSAAPERLRARDERAGEPLERPPRARAGTRPRARSAAGTGTRPGRRAEARRAARATISGTVSGSGSATISGRRSGPRRREHRVDGAGEVLDRQERPRGPSARRGAAARASGRARRSAAMLPFTPGP